MTHLDIRNNRLSGPYSFTIPQRLTWIWLNDNQITSLTLTPATGSPSLQGVIVENNQLTTVPDLSQFPNIQNLYFSGNAIYAPGFTM